MSRCLDTLLVALVLVAAGYHNVRAGGILCWLEACEQDGTLDAQVAELRAKGPAGLVEALGMYDALVSQVEERNKQYLAVASTSNDDAKEVKRGDSALNSMRQLVDQVAGQRDAHISRLYWYTDLEEAKAAAAEAGKPILSLRLLGKLTDEYSCANSRFFRTALYSNKNVSDYLRENYVLHWLSVRPVPRITIDFGDGRKLQRTITGNSAHYVLSSNGQPLDALPGLYGPKAFHEWLTRSKEFADRIALVSNRDQRSGLLKEHHANRRNAIDFALEADLRNYAPQLLQVASRPSAASAPAADPPTAHQAASRAVSKSLGETPLLAEVIPDQQTLEAQDARLWARIADDHAEDARLDEASIELISSENPTAAKAGLRAESKRRQEQPLLRLVDAFERSLALDTVKNEYLLHRQIHDWFVNGDAPQDVNAFNEKVYAELFLTPSSDPWLGLAPPDVYTALNNGGAVE